MSNEETNKKKAETEDGSTSSQTQHHEDSAVMTASPDHASKPDTTSESDSGEKADTKRSDADEVPRKFSLRSVVRALKHKIVTSSKRRIVAACCVAGALIAAVAAVQPAVQRTQTKASGAPASEMAAANSAEPSKSAASQKPARTPAPSRTPAPTPVPTPPPYIYEDFSNSMIIGSSTTEALYIHGVIPAADYLYGTGLTVESIFQKTMPGSDIPIIEELSGDKKYDQVFLAFGLNELGWSDVRVFLEYYAQVVAAVRRYQPQAVIYIESVLPVGIGTSQRNRFGVNQDRINEYNSLLGAFAQENGAYFLDVSTEMKGPDGYLPQDAAADGIHPNLESCGKWADLLKQKAEEVLNGPEAPVLADVQSAPSASTGNGTASSSDENG